MVKHIAEDVELFVRLHGPNVPHRRCASCQAIVPDREIPAVNDDGSWAEEEKYHWSDCKWVATRGHRIKR